MIIYSIKNIQPVNTEKVIQILHVVFHKAATTRLGLGTYHETFWGWVKGIFILLQHIKAKEIPM